MLKKISFSAAMLTLSVSAFANDSISVNADTVEALIAQPVVEAVQKNGQTVLISPRTGVKYTLSNANNVPITFQTEVVAAATAANAGRIVATNPALSPESQQKAQAALVNLVQSNTQF